MTVQSTAINEQEDMPCRVLRGALPKAMLVSLVTRNPDGGGTRTIATQGEKKGSRFVFFGGGF